MTTIDGSPQRSFLGRIHHAPSNPTMLWDLLSPCNFSCDYCYSERLTSRPRSGRSRSTEDTLDSIAAALPGWNINLSGGEPMLHRDFVPIVAGLVERGHRVGIYTNLSRSRTTRELADQVPPAGVEFINAGVHAVQRIQDDPDLMTFAEDFTVLDNAGFPIHASYIVHPENLDRAAADVDRLSSAGVNVRIQVFRGVWEGATYPAAFSPEELELVQQWEAGLDRGRDVRMDFSGDGGDCLAGAAYIEMDPNGDCWRCGAYRSMRRSPLGNMFNGTLRLNDGLARCSMWACLSCRQGHAFHAEGLRDLYTDHRAGSGQN